MAPQIIGIDLSLTAPAYATDAGPFLLKPKTKGCARLAQIESWIVDGAIPYDLGGMPQPSVAVIEGYGVGHGGNVTLGEVGGVVRLALWEWGVPFVTVPPARLKMFAGKGNWNKTQMVVAARDRLGYQGTDDNEADAMWLWHMGRCAYGQAEPTAAQRKILDQIEWPVSLPEEVPACP